MGLRRSPGSKQGFWCWVLLHYAEALHQIIPIPALLKVYQQPQVAALCYHILLWHSDTPCSWCRDMSLPVAVHTGRRQLPTFLLLHPPCLFFAT